MQAEIQSNLSASQPQQIVPEYVDLVTAPAKWYTVNLLYFAASLGMVLIAIFMIEYEVARLANPDAVFMITPMWFDFIIATLVAILGLSNLSILLFVFLRHLWIRPWMLATTIAGWMLISVAVLVLRERFLLILFPTLPL